MSTKYLTPCSFSKPCSVLPLDTLAGDIHLPLDDLPSRSSDRITLLDRIFEIEHILDVLGKVLRELFPLVQRQVGDLALKLLGQGDGTAGDVVRFTEGDLTVS